MEDTIPVFILGKKYAVPDGLTILKALEYVGIKLIRGCGCRGGFCGACGTVYRIPGDHKIKVGLACQTKIEEGMILTQLPYFPANDIIYDMEDLDDPVRKLFDLFPEVLRCLGCNSCTRICPQEIQVMEYMQASIKGDLKTVAEISFDCILCGLCASRCSAETVPYTIGLFARRAYAKTSFHKPEMITNRLKEIKEGTFEEKLDKLKNLSPKELEKIYSNRQIEQMFDL